tara:strand:+ start:313 stop:585 length:273 start_codon:yes stop_codon:yes gene_type:complete
VPLSLIPPDITNNDNKSIINGMYSNSNTCSNSYRATSKLVKRKKGIINNDAQKAEIFPKLLCQNLAEISGIKAIDNKMPIKGIMLYMGNE